MAIYISVRNVAEAYPLVLSELAGKGVSRSSRAGDVVAFDEPVLLRTAAPQERVLLDLGRRANPFFHLMEALWMMAGRRDAKWLDQFVRDFSSRFAEGGGVQHGAYGHRWRYHWNRDQIEMVVQLLKRDHTNRRVVIQMWDPAVDLGVATNDVPCNTTIYPRVVDGRLDLTVCCRSNDIIWGMLGSNIVHFSILQEYMAGKIGVEVGILHQLANNCHAYTSQLERVGVPEAAALSYPGWEPMGWDWSHWDEDLDQFMQAPGTPRAYYNERFHSTAHRMFMAHQLVREGHTSEGLHYADSIEAPDWRRAAHLWISQRLERA